MRTISIVTPCFNEEANVELLYDRVKAVIATIPQYSFELIYIDNASTDNTVKKITALIERDKSVRLIVNARNFGHIRSPYYGLLQANGDAVVLMASDLQDPPELLSKFISQWESGFKIVAGVKTTSEESRIFFMIRKAYYALVQRIADIKLINNFTGFGLYDKKVIEIMRSLNDPYPYLRGMVCEIGFDVAQVAFKQPTRKRGITKNNFYTLYDIAMLGITSHSKVPLRLAVFGGFLLSGLSLLLAFIYLVLKLVAWDSFQLGTAPLLIGLFFFSSVQLFFLGLLGEYVGSIHTQILRRPLVVEKERVNF
ncbi:MAG: glycosyltransferase family 2 protein [Candidatus Paracaedibacteraceae bacterium]|nr:glycosyltransferase family 2 protein [Candidatus Paracaedibacteraceae bacterium]